MSNFAYPQKETLGESTYNIIGGLLPDFGFPDKKMWNILRDIWPGDIWDRNQVFDLYKWYETGLKEGVPFYDVDLNNKQIFDWMKLNSGYTDDKINHWAAVFKRGIMENWIEGIYVTAGMAPEHEGRKIADFLSDPFAKLGSGADKATWLLVAATGLIVAYYGMPIISKTFKKRKKL